MALLSFCTQKQKSLSRAIAIAIAFSNPVTTSRKNAAGFLDFVQIASSPPSPQFGRRVQLFFNAKNVDLSHIQNDTLSKILL